jgi:hypothetical protein
MPHQPHILIWSYELPPLYRGSQLGFPDTDAEGAVEMTRSDWLMPRGAVAHQDAFISSKKVPYGAGLTLMAPPTTDTGQTGNLSDPPPHIFRGAFLSFRHSPFAIHISTDPTGLTCCLGQGVSPCRTSTSVVQRHVGLRQIGREGEARASSRWMDQWGGGTNRWASRIASRMLST